MYSNVKSFRREVGGKSLAPFGWVGGKSKLAPWLVDLIPPHAQYVEVFGGALNLLWAKLPSRLEVVNDIDGELVNLYRTIRNNPESLKSALLQLPYSREFFNLTRDKHITCKNKNSIDRAALSYYIIMSSFSSKRLHFGRNRLAKSGESKHGHVKRLYRDFGVWSRRLRSVQIENLEFSKLIKDYDHIDTFFYLDPPYYGMENYYINHSFTKDRHEELANILRHTQGKWLLSYNDHPTIRELYKGFYIVETPEIIYSLNGFGRTKKVSEIVITNYKIEG